MDRSWHTDSTLLAHFRRGSEREREREEERKRLEYASPIPPPRLEREKGLCAVYLLKMALRMGWDKMGWGRIGRGARFLQVVVRNPILQLSCLKSPSSAAPPARPPASHTRTWLCARHKVQRPCRLERHPPARARAPSFFLMAVGAHQYVCRVGSE